MPFKILIPARYGSERLPGKPLREIDGKPMILHVIEKAQRTRASEVIVATDDERIQDVVVAAGADCEMTAKEHSTGTERITEVALKRAWSSDAVVVNLQGDEPMMVPDLMEQVANLLIDDEAAAIATLCLPFHDRASLDNPNIVKVVFDHSHYAQYFSRAAIPYPRDDDNFTAYRHLGLYAYRVGTLKKLITLRPTEHEQLEKLEQLRALDHGMKIKMAVAQGVPGHGVDTEEDLERVDKLLRSTH